MDALDVLRCFVGSTGQDEELSPRISISTLSLQELSERSSLQSSTRKGFEEHNSIGVLDILISNLAKLTLCIDTRGINDFDALHIFIIERILDLNLLNNISPMLLGLKDILLNFVCILLCRQMVKVLLLKSLNPFCDFTHQNAVVFLRDDKTHIQNSYGNITIVVVHSCIILQELLNSLFIFKGFFATISIGGLQNKLLTITDFDNGGSTLLDIHRENFFAQIGINESGLTALGLASNHQQELVLTNIVDPLFKEM